MNMGRQLLCRYRIAVLWENYKPERDMNNTQLWQNRDIGRFKCRLNTCKIIHGKSGKWKNIFMTQQSKSVTQSSNTIQVTTCI